MWLARDLPGVSTWTLAYEAPPTNWFGTAMPIQDRAKNILELLLSERHLAGCPIVFVCHSLGGLLIKQVLRAADGRQAYKDDETRKFLAAVRGIVFIATPHTGSIHATLLEKLRLIAWPSASTLDLVKNNANLRDLNVWYRNWSGSISHKVFYEKRGTTAGIIVEDDSSDPGLLWVDPVAIDASHIDICKPIDAREIIYSRTRDFIANIPRPNPITEYGQFVRYELPTLPRTSSNKLIPIILRLIALGLLAFVILEGFGAIINPPSRRIPTNEQIEIALRSKTRSISQPQIDQYIRSLQDLRGDPSFDRAIEEAKRGQTELAEATMVQLYENARNDESKARLSQGRSARNIGALVATRDAGQGLNWYQKATALDPDNQYGWIGLANAALKAQNFTVARQGFERFVQMARRENREKEIAVGLIGLGEAFAGEHKWDEAQRSFQKALAVEESLTQQRPADAELQHDLAVSYERVGQVLLEQEYAIEALDLFKKSLAIRESLLQSDCRSSDMRRNLAITYERIGDALVKAGNSSDAFIEYRRSFTIRNGIANLYSGASNQDDLPVALTGEATNLSNSDFSSDLWRCLSRPSRRAASTVQNLLAKETRHDLAVSLDRLGDMYRTKGDLPDARQSYKDSYEILRKLSIDDPSNAVWRDDLRTSVGKIGTLAFRMVLARQFTDALETAEFASLARPDLTWIHSNRAHALMFLGRVGEASAIYLGHRGEKIDGQKEWESYIVSDFAKLRKENLTHPLMSEVENQFKS